MGDSHTTVVRGLVAPFRGEQGGERITETSRKGRLGAPLSAPTGEMAIFRLGAHPPHSQAQPPLRLVCLDSEREGGTGGPRQECGPSMTSGNVSVWVFETETGGSSPPGPAWGEVTLISQQFLSSSLSTPSLASEPQEQHHGAHTHVSPSPAQPGVMNRA